MGASNNYMQIGSPDDQHDNMKLAIELDTMVKKKVQRHQRSAEEYNTVYALRNGPKIVAKIRAMLKNKRFLKTVASNGTTSVTVKTTMSKHNPNFPVPEKELEQFILNELNVDRTTTGMRFSQEKVDRACYANGEHICHCVFASLIFPPVGIPISIYSLVNHNRVTLTYRISWDNLDAAVPVPVPVPVTDSTGLAAEPPAYYRLYM